MTYGLGAPAPAEIAPAGQDSSVDSERSTARIWKALDESRRLALIECALNAGNDRESFHADERMVR